MRFSKFIIILMLFFSISLNGFAQKQKTRKEIRKEKKEQVESRIDSILTAKNYVFVAQSAHPLSMPVVNLTSEYTLNVSGDSVYVYLPYFGRAYRADYMSTEGGIKYEGLYEDYSFEKRKEQFRIGFTADGESDTYIFKLNVSSSGYATLLLSCYNRQAITFNGLIDDLGL